MVPYVLAVNRLWVPPNALMSGSRPAKKFFNAAAVSGRNEISALFLFLVYEHLHITLFNPLRYYMVILWGIFLKGVGILILWPNMVILLVMGIAVLTIISLRFRKTIG